jgi:hypothetical protein
MALETLGWSRFRARVNGFDTPSHRKAREEHKEHQRPHVH